MQIEVKFCGLWMAGEVRRERKTGSVDRRQIGGLSFAFGRNDRADGESIGGLQGGLAADATW